MTGNSDNSNTSGDDEMTDRLNQLEARLSEVEERLSDVSDVADAAGSSEAAEKGDDVGAEFERHLERYERLVDKVYDEMESLTESLDDTDELQEEHDKLFLVNSDDHARLNHRLSHIDVGMRLVADVLRATLAVLDQERNRSRQLGDAVGEYGRIVMLRLNEQMSELEGSIINHQGQIDQQTAVVQQQAALLEQQAAVIRQHAAVIEQQAAFVAKLLGDTPPSSN